MGLLVPVLRRNKLLGHVSTLMGGAIAQCQHRPPQPALKPHGLGLFPRCELTSRHTTNPWVLVRDTRLLSPRQTPAHSTAAAVLKGLASVGSTTPDSTGLSTSRRLHCRSGSLSSGSPSPP